jgi:pantothenate kinase
MGSMFTMSGSTEVDAVIFTSTKVIMFQRLGKCCRKSLQRSAYATALNSTARFVATIAGPVAKANSTTTWFSRVLNLVKSRNPSRTSRSRFVMDLIEFYLDDEGANKTEGPVLNL